MNGMINRAIERFIRDTYGREEWLGLIRIVKPGMTEFEPMLAYEDDLTHRLVTHLSERLKKPVSDLLEDLGTYMASHPNMEAVRRLLRFAGEDFTSFLMSLEELPERARLALSTLDLPKITLEEMGDHYFFLHIHSTAAGLPGFGHVLAGLLRAMADDYGSLVILNYLGHNAGVETIEISLADTTFTSGRSFSLGEMVL